VKLGELSESSITVDVHDVLANDEHVTGLHRTSARRAGKSYETTEVIVFHVQAGRVSEAWEHPFNIYGLDEVFS
jgi:uncharacterized protein